LRALLAALPPLAAFAVQWAFWSTIRPFAWFLFYPAVFASSWIGGLRAGLAATAASTVLAAYFFVPPEGSFRVDEPRFFLTTGVFVGMGILFSLSHGRLRRANQEVAAANGQLRHANDEITRLYEKTRELDELRSRFFAAVSHELRTPLALILGPTERLLAAPEIPEAARRDLEIVARNAGTLLRHVGDLLDMAKLEAGGMELAYVETDVARVVRFVAGHFEVLSQERRVAFAVEAPPHLKAHVDPDKLQRVLQNLLSNAFKFTPHGGRVRVTLREAAARVRLEVADSGPGIPPDKREAVFERFRQLDGGATRRFGGTGLGLSIADDLVALHGGVIAVFEAPEGGALVAVELPRWAPARTEVRAAAPADVAGGAAEVHQAVEELRARPARAPTATGAAERPLVLVVEDDPEMNRFIAESLGDRYRVAVAVDGKDGLTKACALGPDLILSDVMMPEMSGDELVRALRARPEFAATPIVMLTARADDDLRVRLLREGAQDYLTKPFSIEELRARIDNLIARKRAEEEGRRLSRQLEEVARANQVITSAITGLPETSVNAVLQTIALRAQAMTGAEYAAVGIGTDPARPFDPWVFVGLSQEAAAAIGHPPRPVGLLGAVALGNQTIRGRDLRRHPAHQGLPLHHPEMKSFLGAPILSRGRSVGNLYLANKRGAEEFTEHDQAVVEMLAHRVGLAIETAGLYQAEGLERVWLQTVVDQMPDGVVLMDARGQVKARNRFYLMLCRDDPSEDDPFGNPVMIDLRRPSGERVPAADRPNVRAIQRGETLACAEFLIRLRDDRLVPVLVSAAPVRDRAGQLAGATMILRDISALKELERLREEWASVIAHDLRQPVSVILFATESLRTQHAGEILERARKTLARIEGAALTLNRMINDLLDVSRIEARRLTLERREVDLASLVRELVDRTPEAAGRCDASVGPGAEAPVWADPGRIEQALGNLLSNALKYGDPGTRIAVDLQRRGDEVEVTFTNAGRGIEPEDVPLLFDRFHRSCATRRSGVPGIGLGLYITRSLVEAHRGRIWVESTPGVTTSFHVTLPVACSRVEAAREEHVLPG
jgi:signal transduction histidine kinase/DNA-binding response OmpR family regulator